MVRPLQQMLGQSIANSRTGMVLLSVFGGIALLMAATGLYGVMAYSVSQRTREIGLRMALGAERGRVLRLVVGPGMLLTTVGLVLGLAGSVALTRLLHDFLYETSPTDPVIFAGISLTLACISLLACYIPSRCGTSSGLGCADLASSYQLTWFAVHLFQTRIFKEKTEFRWPRQTLSP